MTAEQHTTTEPCRDCGDSGYESIERGTLCPTCNGANADFSDYPQETPAERTVVGLMDALFQGVERAKADRRGRSDG